MANKSDRDNRVSSEENRSGEKFLHTIIAVIVGVTMGFGSSFGLWHIQSSHSHETKVKNKREELIVETADLFARAGRIKGLIHGHMLQIATSNAITSLCLSMQLQGKDSKECSKNIDYKIMNDFNKEIFEYSAKYQKLKSLIPLYFCEETISQFNSVEMKEGWWEITSKKTAIILKAMHQEYECSF